jgi:hypothetical protein
MMVRQHKMSRLNLHIPARPMQNFLSTIQNIPSEAMLPFVHATRDEIKHIMKQRIAENAFQAFNGISPE